MHHGTKVLGRDEWAAFNVGEMMMKCMEFSQLNPLYSTLFSKTKVVRFCGAVIGWSVNLMCKLVSTPRTLK